MSTDPYWTNGDGQVTLYREDSLKLLRTLPDASVDAVVCDPPYALTELPTSVVVDALTRWLAGDRAYTPPTRGGFMGASWDAFVPPPALWDQCLRVLKPGGHLLAFSAPRTYDLMAMSVRLAGFDLRDEIATLLWAFGSGWPKGQAIGKAIDKAAGATREVVGQGPYANRRPRVDHGTQGLAYADDAYVRPAGQAVTAPATEQAAAWEGWNTTLRPAHEPVVVARKPLAGTVAANVLEHGTGALNIADCRVEAAGPDVNASKNKGRGMGYGGGSAQRGSWDGTSGRWPGNLVLVHHPDCGDRCVPVCHVAEMERQAPGSSRYFPIFRYEAKAPQHERPRLADGTAWSTVKPLELMRWLCRLVTPPGGLILDPCCGTATTGQAAAEEGFDCILVERDPVAAELAKVRLSKPLQPALFGGAA